MENTLLTKEAVVTQLLLIGFIEETLSATVTSYSSVPITFYKGSYEWFYNEKILGNKVPKIELEKVIPLALEKINACK